MEYASTEWDTQPAFGALCHGNCKWLVEESGSIIVDDETRELST
jgi:hypothetical protein